MLSHQKGETGESPKTIWNIERMAKGVKKKVKTPNIWSPHAFYPIKPANLNSKTVDSSSIFAGLTCGPDPAFGIVPFVRGLFIFDGERVNWQSACVVWSHKSELNCRRCDFVGYGLLQSRRLASLF